MNNNNMNEEGIILANEMNNTNNLNENEEVEIMTLTKVEENVILNEEFTTTETTENEIVLENEAPELPSMCDMIEISSFNTWISGTLSSSQNGAWYYFTANAAKTHGCDCLGEYTVYSRGEAPLIA